MASRMLVLGGALALALFRAKTVSAQGTNATCLSQYSWMDNERGQSPCLVTAYLISACLADPTDAYVYSLPEDFHYTPPAGVSATKCQCNTIFYSVISACATCQNNPSSAWSAWQTNCSTDYVGVWPTNIPIGSSIPAWAYLDVATPDAFNVSAAQADAAQNPPDSSAIPSPTSSSASTSVGFSSSPGVTGSAATESFAPSSTPPATAAASSSSKKSDVGPIVGGVVGGVGGAAIIAGVIVFWFMHRRKTSSANAYASAADPAAAPFAPQGDMGTPYAEKPVFDPTGYTAPSGLDTPPPPTGAMLVYNPNDPSTFPTTSGSPPPMSLNGTTVYNPSLSQGYAPATMSGGNSFSHQPGGYSGVAEV